MADAPVAVVVPVKGGPLAKTRLGLELASRRDLADAFARDTVAAVRAGLPDSPVLVVTSDVVASGWAREAGCGVVDDPGAGLDAAVTAGVAQAARAGSRFALVLLGDHPALRPSEIAAVVRESVHRAPAFVPDADGHGTACLLVPTGPEAPATRFGAGSAAAHAALGYTVLEPDAPGLRTDVDDAGSLADALGLGVGRWTRSALARASLPGVQATIHRSPDDGPGSALLDDGVEVRVPLAALASSGLLHLRVGQRVSIELDATGLVATRVWVVGIGDGEPIR
ncbi:2-phospho-L-lactate guanylyltransferase [Phycicoccus duodecadis]|uniref:2-phospho-L-lactate guanylyltransferase n=1 Tax=Phycicoccus duodecadis TaxID=173053 RepID=A0A2N3YGE8_9MICO|nr:2-phospho-L-lactate guanylyltransferase [Phycicoccus duodecadis]PKW25909.1 2-phospho-L-lactate guanylyltransferase [Phycicoccus duodecadis]